MSRLFLRWYVAALAGLVLLLPGLPSHAASGAAVGTSAWRAGASLPTAADWLTAAPLGGGSVVVLGGETSNIRLAALLLPGAASWTRYPDAPVDIGTPAALALTPEMVMVVAPSFASGALAAPSKALLLDVTGRTWMTLPSVPVPLLRPVLYRLDATRIIAVGGLGGFVGAVFDLYNRRWTPIGAPVSNVASYSTVMLPGRGMMMMITVVIDEHSQPRTVRRACLLTTTLKWVTLAQPPFTSDGAQAVVLDANRVLFAGARPTADSPGSPEPRPLLYTATSDTWTTTSSTGQDHRGGTLVAVGGGRALLVSGHSVLGEPTMQCLLFDGRTWLSAGSLPDPWAAFAAVAVDEYHVLLIGGDRRGLTTMGPVADTIEWSLDPVPAG